MVGDKACVEIVDYTPYYQKDVNNKYVFSTVKKRGLLPRLQAIVATPMGVRAYHKFQRFFRE